VTKSTSEPVTIRLLDREYTVGCEPDERDGLMAAARLLDAKMREVRGSNRMAALDRVAVLTALNLAAELLQVKSADGSQDQAIARTLGEMNRKLDGLFDSLATR
jgi:cell division protein ZapA